MTYLPKMEVTGDDLSVSFDVTSVVYSLVRQVEKYVGEGAVSEVIAFLTEDGHLDDMIRKEKEKAWDEGYSVGAVDIWLSQTQNPYKEEA